MIQLEGREVFNLCRDDGKVGDPTPGDGIWACGELPEGEVWVLVDGRRMLVGQAQRGSAPSGIAGSPVTPAPAILVQIDAGATQQIPMVALHPAVGEMVQLSCHDNGEFPDSSADDSVAHCGGVAPSRELRVEVRRSSGNFEQPVVFEGEDAVLFVRFDGLRYSTEPWELGGTAATASAVSGGGGGAPSGAGGPAAGGGGGEGPPRGAAWWSLLLAGAALVAGVGLGRWRRGDLPTGLAWAQPAGPGAVEERRGPLDELVLEASRRGPVVVLCGDRDLPEGEPGPVLRATSADVLDLLDALSQLRSRRGIQRVDLVIEDVALLESPGEVGLKPLERLRSELPPGTRALLMTE
jgi:hypothetical protein